MEILCKIEGLAPVLQNQFTGDKKAEDITLNDRAYKDEKGMYMPTNNIRMMLIGNKKRRSASEILGSDMEKAKGTKYKNFCKACVFIEGLDGDTSKVYFEPSRKAWDDVDKRTYQNDKGARNHISRPMITMPWSLTFKIHVFSKDLADATIRKLFEVAGFRCGLGDFGPTFGRFIVKKWEIIEEN